MLRPLSSFLIGLGLGAVLLGVGGLAWPLAFHAQLDGWSGLYLFFTGFGPGIAAAEALGFWHDLDEKRSYTAQRDALTEQTQVSNAERWQVVEVKKLPAPPPTDTTLEQKRDAIETFFRMGDKLEGFSEGKLAGVVGSDHGPRLRHFYMSIAGGEWLYDYGSSRGTDWAPNRDLTGLLVALRAGTLPLPPGPVPDVKWIADSAAQRRAPQKGKRESDTEPGPSKRVIEHVNDHPAKAAQLEQR